jgi:hypothetical protein
MLLTSDLSMQFGRKNNLRRSAQGTVGVASIRANLPTEFGPDAVGPDPHDLLITFLSERMKMRPISKRVNGPQNDHEGLLAEIDFAAAS